MRGRRRQSVWSQNKAEDQNEEERNAENRGNLVQFAPPSLEATEAVPCRLGERTTPGKE